MIAARAITTLALCALVCACGSSKKSFEESFNQNFEQNFVSSCVKSATDSGVDEKFAGLMCRCASNKVNERFSVKEKMSLKVEQLKPIMAECKIGLIR